MKLNTLIEQRLQFPVEMKHLRLFQSVLADFESYSANSRKCIYDRLPTAFRIFL